MLPIDQWFTEGEHPFFFTGGVGRIEAMLMVPAGASDQHIALLGHPHSLHGGSMNNKVITTLARAFRDLGIRSLRFNFRGVGHSAGQFDAGKGESEDMLALMELCAEASPDVRFLLAGFSFGSYVAWRASALKAHDLLLMVAPPVHHFDYLEFSSSPAHWHIIQGDADEIVPLQTVLDFAAHFTPPLPIVRFAETGHFFHGHLLKLREEVVRLVSTQVLTR
jgi:uncharacterized protein